MWRIEEETGKKCSSTILAPGILRRKSHYVNEAKRTLHCKTVDVISLKLHKNVPPNITGNQSQSWARSQKI